MRLSDIADQIEPALAEDDGMRLSCDMRRDLMRIVINARDEDTADLLAGVRQLQRRHPVCVASLREAMLDELLKQPPQRVDTALEASAAAQYLSTSASASTPPCAPRARSCSTSPPPSCQACWSTTTCR
ncbi:MAG: hypothetical protein H4O13_05185 [Xanthomonadales bacterium]|nr:hypothetical protein [Xanthomonadales bacterium]